MKLAVVGSPIAHSRSPQIHLAAYRTLGLDWTYERIEQQPATLGMFLDGLESPWRGLSVTAPLKEAAAAWCDEIDEVATLAGDVCNTVRVDLRRGWNTDVYGIVETFRDAGVASVERGAIIGGGATAVSSLVALAQLGADVIHLRLRDPAKSAKASALAAQLHVELEVAHLDEPVGRVDAAISTLPAAAEATVRFEEVPAALLDADYAREGGRFAAFPLVLPGLEMLLHQALAQVRIFVHGDADRSLPDEDAVWRAMRAAIAS